MPDKPVRFAIVGLGMGRVRAKECKQVAGAELALLCDIDKERLERSCKEFEVPGVASYDEVLKRDDIDAVMILTPSGMHADMGIAAARAGKHVVSTKPLDVSLEAIDRLIKVCDKQKVLLAVDFQERYTDMPQRVRAALDQGLFGDLILIEARLKWFRGDEYYYDATGRDCQPVRSRPLPDPAAGTIAEPPTPPRSANPAGSGPGRPRRTCVQREARSWRASRAPSGL